MPSRSEITRFPILAALSATLVMGGPATAGRPASVSTVIPLIVRTPHAGFNRMVVSVTVCSPGTDRCATIDDVMVDTGSTGLRLEASAVPPSIELPAFLDGAGEPLAECLHFVHDTAWGPLRRADLRMGGMMASDLAIQIIADDGRPQPAGCPASNVRPTSNGTLGIGPWLVDCPGACEQDEAHPGVFVDRAGAWSPFPGPVDRAYRLQNPVAAFPQHDNGVVFDLPLPPHDGATQVVGTLTFGVSAASDSRADGIRIVSLDRQGRFSTLYGGQAYPNSSIDSGTETNLLPEGIAPSCKGMPSTFCASPELDLAAMLVGSGGTNIDVAFRVGDYRGALDRHVGAWDGFAEAIEPSRKAIVWGAPFFFGRQVFVIFDGRGVPGMPGTIGPAYGIH